MKTMRFFTLLCAVMMSFALASCNKTGEPDGPNNPNGDVIGGNYEVGVWYEEGNNLIYVLEYDYYIYSYKVKWTLTFDDNDLCIKSICEYTFNDATIAQAFYEDMLAAGDDVTKSGNTITEDVTEYYAGMSKEDIKRAISYM